MSDLIRVVVIVEMVAMVGCGAFLHTSMWPHLPAHFRLIGTAFGWSLTVVGGAVTLNLATRQPLSPGLVLVAVAVLPAVVAVLVETVRTIRTHL